MLALRCLALSEDGRWDDHFDRLRRGEIVIPTGAARRRRPPVARLPEKLKKTG
jgi:hypothetical protein